jgi:HEPN domain-containing protein
MNKTPDNMPGENPKISEHLRLRTLEMIQYGDDDLDTARKVLEGEHTIPRKACIEAHTAAEKYLKAFLLFKKYAYRKYRHDLSEVLTACCKIDPMFGELNPDIKFINKYKGEVDYPPPKPYSYIASEDMANEIIDRAERVKKFVVKRLQELGCVTDL